MQEIVKLSFGVRRGVSPTKQLKMLGYARDLPAIVFAMEFVGEEIKLGLQLLEVLGILDRAWLTRLQLYFLQLGVQAERLDGPAALLQTLRGLIGVTLVGKKEIMIQRFGIGQRFVQFLVHL